MMTRAGFPAIMVRGGKDRVTTEYVAQGAGQMVDSLNIKVRLAKAEYDALKKKALASS